MENKNRNSFSGSLEMAERFIELGMMISFSGVVTFKKALDVQEAAQKYFQYDRFCKYAGCL